MLGLTVARIRRSENPSYVEILCICLVGTGVLMNLVVVLLNGKMPVATAADSIPEEDRVAYQPMDDRTLLPPLGDWIDVGWAYFSPGDILIYLGVFGLIVRAVFVTFL